MSPQHGATIQPKTIPRIMIVEDEALIALDLKSILEGLGYLVGPVVSSGEEAVRLASLDKPDLILMDITLAGKMDGLEAAAKIHSLQDIPIVFTTAWADQDRIERAKLTYPFGYQLKPYDEQDLKITIDMALYVANADRLRKKAERQLRQVQKMEAIGTLAGGIAHEFNNSLAAIMGYTELAMLDVAEGTAIRINLEQVMKACHRAKNLIQQIVSFSQVSTEEHKPIELGLLVKEALTFLRASLPSTIEIRQDLGQLGGLVLADPTQIHQVLTNICANAAKAMGPKGGVLTVILSAIDLQHGDHTLLGELPPGRYQRLIVSDTGHGMDQKTLERIFEPFFTTKAPGEGTGMGLAVVYGIVKDHSGAIKVYSEPGKGSTFQVYLPLISPPSPTAPIVNTASPPGGTERILLIDDEEALATMGRHILEQLGYCVDAMTSSQEALEVFRSNPQKFDLVITDQTMPNLTGKDLARELMRIRLDIPVILCTGFSQQVAAEEAVKMGIKRFLMKPLVLRELAEAVRSVLDHK